MRHSAVEDRGEGGGVDVAAGKVTPLSTDSKGLAVVEKTSERIVVRELFQGLGTYEFDYTVTAVRRGHEDFEVIRPIHSAQAAAGDDDRVHDEGEDEDEVEDFEEALADGIARKDDK